MIRKVVSYETLKFFLDIEKRLVGRHRELPAGAEGVKQSIPMKVQTYNSCKKRTITSLSPKSLLIVGQARTGKYRRRLTSKPPVPRKTGRRRAAVEEREGPPLKR